MRTSSLAVAEGCPPTSLPGALRWTVEAPGTSSARRLGHDPVGLGGRSRACPSRPCPARRSPARPRRWPRTTRAASRDGGHARAPWSSGSTSPRRASSPRRRRRSVDRASAGTRRRSGPCIRCPRAASSPNVLDYDSAPTRRASRRTVAPCSSAIPPRRRIDASTPPDADAGVTNRRLLYELPSDMDGSPDGAQCDADGCLCVAISGGSEGDSHLARRRRRPRSNSRMKSPPSVTFGGRDLARARHHPRTRRRLALYAVRAPPRCARRRGGGVRRHLRHRSGRGERVTARGWDPCDR